MPDLYLLFSKVYPEYKSKKDWMLFLKYRKSEAIWSLLILEYFYNDEIHWKPKEAKSRTSEESFFVDKHPMWDSQEVLHLERCLGSHGRQDW